MIAKTAPAPRRCRYVSEGRRNGFVLVAEKSAITVRSAKGNFVVFLSRSVGLGDGSPLSEDSVRRHKRAPSLVPK